MTRVLTEGFEIGTTPAGWSLASSATPAAIQTGGRPPGTYRLRRPSSASPDTASASCSGAAGQSEVYMKFAFWGELGSTTFTWLTSSGSGLTVALSAGAFPTWNVPKQTSGTTAYTSGKRVLSGWNVIEFHWKLDGNGNGIFETRMNGQDDLQLTNIYTANSPGVITGNFSFSWGGANGHAASIDDVCINNASGTADNSWVGDTYIFAIFPNGNGSSSGMLGSDGNQVDNYLLVDERPPSASDYVLSTVPGTYDLYNVGNISATVGPNDTIVGLEVIGLAIETVAEARTAQVGLKSGSVTEWQAQTTLNTGSYAHIKHRWRVNPETGSPWTRSEVDAIEIGVKHTT